MTVVTSDQIFTLPDADLEPKQARLREVLKTLVPQWVERLRARSTTYRKRKAKECLGYLSQHGKNLLIRVGDIVEPSDYNRLAEGLACVVLEYRVVIFAGCLFRDVVKLSEES